MIDEAVFLGEFYRRFGDDLRFYIDSASETTHAHFKGIRVATFTNYEISKARIGMNPHDAMEALLKSKEVLWDLLQVERLREVEKETQWMRDGLNYIQRMMNEAAEMSRPEPVQLPRQFKVQITPPRAL